MFGVESHGHDFESMRRRSKTESAKVFQGVGPYDAGFFWGGAHLSDFRQHFQKTALEPTCVSGMGKTKRQAAAFFMSILAILGLALFLIFWVFSGSPDHVALLARKPMSETQTHPAVYRIYLVEIRSMAQGPVPVLGFGGTRALRFALDSASGALVNCRQHRPDHGEANPGSILFAVDLHPIKPGLQVHSVSQTVGALAKSGDEIACLRQTLERLEMQPLAELTRPEPGSYQIILAVVSGLSRGDSQ